MSIIEFLTLITQTICSAIFIIFACNTVSESYYFKEFVLNLVFSIIFFFFSLIPHSFKSYELRESILVESELTEHENVVRIMVDHDRLYKIREYSDVITLKNKKFNVYKQVWSKKYSIMPFERRVRVFDLEGNWILDL